VISRRTFVGALAGGLLAAPLAAEEQRAAAARVPRIGTLWQAPASAPTIVRVTEGFKQGLERAGYVEGKTVTVDYRYAEQEQMARAANDLVGLSVDVIVTGGTPATIAAMRATSTLPIVGGSLADPVADGLVASLSKPGGNVTGNTFLAPSLGPKRLQLLREIVPTVSKIAALQHPGVYSERTMQDMLNDSKAAARALGVELLVFQAKAPDQFDGAFAAMRDAHVGASIIFPSPMFYAQYRRLVDAAGRHMPTTIYYFREAVETGGLLSYGADLTDLFRRTAAYVDKILMGAKPADLPVEQPSTFELIINLKTAKALGLTIPPSLLARADEVIQ